MKLRVVILVAIISLVSSYDIVESPILKNFGRARAAQSWKRKRESEAFKYPNSFERRSGTRNRRRDSESEDEDYFVNLRTGETFMRRAWSAPEQTPGSDRFIINPMSFGGYPPVFNPFLPRPRPRPPPPKPIPDGPPVAPGPGPGWSKRPRPKPKPKKKPKPKPYYYEEEEDYCDCKNKGNGGYSSSYSKPEKTTTAAPEVKLCPCEKEKSYQETTKHADSHDSDSYKDLSALASKLPCPLARLLYPTSEKKKCKLHHKPDPDPIQAHLDEYDHGQSDLVLPTKKKPCPYQSKSVLDESYSVPQNKVQQTPKIRYASGGTAGKGGGGLMTVQGQSSQSTPIIVIKSNPPQHISPFGSLQQMQPQQQQRVVVQLPQNQGRALPQPSPSNTVAYKLDLATNTITPIIQNVAPPPVMPTVVNHGGISYLLGGQSSLQQAQTQLRQPQQFVIVNNLPKIQRQPQPIVIQQQPQILSSTIFDSIPSYRHQSSSLPVSSIFSKYNSQSELSLDDDLDDYVKLPLLPTPEPSSSHNHHHGMHPYEIVSLKRKKPKTLSLPAPIYEPVMDDDKEYVLIDRDELLQDKRSGTGSSNIPVNIPPPPEIVHISSHPKDEILRSEPQLPFPDNFFKLLRPESNKATRKTPVEPTDEFSRIFQLNNDKLLESDDGRSSTGHSLPSGFSRRKGKSTIVEERGRSDIEDSQESTEVEQIVSENNGAISYSGDGKKTTTNEENSQLNKEDLKGAELRDSIKADGVLVDTTLNLDLEGIDMEYYYEDEDDIFTASETKNVTKS